MLEIFQYSFMIRAFIAGLIVAIIAPLIGNFLLVRRFSMVADTLSHVALAGVALGLLTHTAPIFITIILTTIAAIWIEKIRSSQKIAGETVLAMFLPGGLAVSIVLISLADGFNSNLFSYLFGSITTVSSAEIWPMLILGIASLATVILFYRQLLFSSFDEEGAKLNGINVKLISFILMTLTAITVSLAMRVVGILLIGALMVIPSVTGMALGKSFKQSFIYSIIFAVLAVILGLYSAFYLDLPAGGAVVLAALGIFAVVSAIKKRH
jgi:zinc transport system permease protein